MLTAKTVPFFLFIAFHFLSLFIINETAMSQYCPLCGKSKPEKWLFCTHCKEKIEKEYEVDVPGIRPEPEGEDVTGTGDVAERPRRQGVVELEQEEMAEARVDAVSGSRGGRGLVWGALLLLGLLLVAGFFYYGDRVRKGNLERFQWEMALKENSVSGYLAYMQAFPKGKHYALAEENLMRLKGDEAETWNRLQSSDNRTELQDFVASYPQSPYIPLVKKRLDSLTWVAVLNDNTAEGYSDYMVASQSGELPGDYFADAQKRFELLFQSYPVAPGELDTIRANVGRFFAALSALDAAGIVNCLAPTVFRFFNSAGGEREKIVGDLLVSGARTEAPTIQFLPNVAAIAYEKTVIEHYKVNVPLQKNYLEGGKQRTISGYIVQLELDREFRILTVTERKPFPDAV